MKMLDLFAGIGGFSLAGHWAGWETVAFVEWDSFCQKVLKKNFPNVPVYGDIKQFDGTQYTGTVDIICGGFPCQPFSSAGKRKGTADDRYLWPEMLRVIREVKPDWVVGENVAGLISMDGGVVLESVCADLEGEGYAVQPFVIPACAVGAPHRRDRIWIVARFTTDTGHAEQPGGWVEAGNDRGSGKGQQAVGEHSSSDQLFTRNPAIVGTQAERGIWGGMGDDTDRAHATTSNTRCPQNNGAIHGQIGNGQQQGRTLADGAETVQQGRGTEANDFSGLRFTPWSEHWLQAATRLCGIHDGLSGGLHKNRLEYGNKMDGSEAGSKGNAFANWDEMRNMRSAGEFGKTSPRPLKSTELVSGSLQSLPCEGRSEDWIEEKEKTEGLQGLREDVHSDTFNQAQYLQPGVLVGNREDKRSEKVEKDRHRAKRLKALGNAIVPQVAYQIFQAINEQA